MITHRLADLVREALQRTIADGLLPPEGVPQIDFNRPKRRQHGDWATNVALAAAGPGARPRDIAQALAERLPYSPLVARVEVAGPGFLNFHLSPAWLHDVVRRAADPGSAFARSEEGRGARVDIEYVSANPTGPLNVVSGRHAAVGDAVANLLAATGYDVTREYYVNDAGRQIELFAQSVVARYLEHFGIDAAVPEDGYKGDYVREFAQDIAREVGDELLERAEADRDEAIRRMALARVLAHVRSSLEGFGTTFDVWSSETSLHDSGAVDKAIGLLEEKGVVAERDGALWFLSSRFGDDKDRVLRRATGEPTYLAADVAYLLDKFGRGFERLVYLWGADHHGTVPRLLAAAEALGFERERVEVQLLQIVTLSRQGEALKASKRAGVLVPVDELVAEVGADAARYTFLTRSLDVPLDFDIDLVKEQAPENPVYYVQYAHARICSILRRAQQEALGADVGNARLERLGHDSEDVLMRKLASYEEVVPDAARLRAPQKIARYAEELASDFSAFYRDCRVLSEDAELSKARLALCLATRRVIADALGLLGVRAPESM